jgi:hypothetical protein
MPSADSRIKKLKDNLMKAICLPKRILKHLHFISFLEQHNIHLLNDLKNAHFNARTL